MILHKSSRYSGEVDAGKIQILDYSLYLITDRSLMSAPSLETAVEQAIMGGCTCIQLREKAASSKELFELALRIKKITDAYSIPLIINDRIDLALAVKASGVHLGQQDLPISNAREISGECMIIGVSTATVSEAVEAELAGADYIGVGAMFATKTKDNTRSVNIELLKQIREAVKLPIVAIGGINRQNLSKLKNTGIDGIAVVTAIISAGNIKRAAQEMKNNLQLNGIIKQNP